MAGALSRTKSIDRLMADVASSGEATLKRTLGPFSLVALGIGAIIGAGLFVRTAAAIAERAGPSVTAGLHRRRPRLRVRRPLLRRVRLDDPDRRQRLHLFLRDDGRAGGVDHRLGPRASSTRSAPPRSPSPGASTSTRCSSTSACTCPIDGVTRRSRCANGVHGIMNIPAVFILLILSPLLDPRHAGVGDRQQHHRRHQGRRSC